jgi:hypothetical protein
VLPPTDPDMCNCTHEVTTNYESEFSSSYKCIVRTYHVFTPEYWAISFAPLDSTKSVVSESNHNLAAVLNACLSPSGSFDATLTIDSPM